MKKVLLMILLLLCVLFISCSGTKTINFDLSIIEEFLDYNNVALVHNADIKFYSADPYIKESQDDGLIISKENFNVSYKKINHSYSFYFLEFSNPNVALQGIRLIGKRSEEIKNIFVTDSNVRSVVTPSYITYTVLRNENDSFFLSKLKSESFYTKPFEIIFTIKNDYVVSIWMGFDM